LKGEPLLILLDELPPYLVNAKSRTIGNTDLAVVTATALSNLLVAVNKDELANVCVVISDLRATYEEGTELINKVLRNLENEVGRVALNLEPVALNTDEIYHILRKRIFADLPDDKAVIEVARAYAKALQDARQMDITNVSPEKLIQQIRESYPFHPDIRDLYARFRENPGYQQTRDLIRLMRKVVADLYSGQEQKADRIQLIAAHDLDLNKQDILTEISNINPSLVTLKKFPGLLPGYWMRA
jgi:predicted AAA+ superfamily ATPase